GQGRLRWRAHYRAWGNTLQEQWEATDLDGRPMALDATEQTDALEQNLRFQGQYLDRDTGLHYNTFRYYDPDVGRFISPDPTGLDGGENLYAYSANPLSWIDPWGWAKTPLNKGGFMVYGLYRPGESEPYYVGHTEQTPTARESQHRGTGRLAKGAKLVPLAGDGGTLTYSQAKGYEQAYSEKYGTKKGFPGNVIEPINKGRTDARGKSHYKNYRAAAKDIGIKPKRGKC
ncbi:MAG: RHS repeat-associated core domain-containing protein, partial [Thermomicrobiales bacterium]